MATSTTRDRQTRLSHDCGVLDYEIGDLIRVGPSGKKSLTECPLCASDPSRERHEFKDQANRADHFADSHGPEAIPTRRR
jgi:hypothetical protein